MEVGGSGAVRGDGYNFHDLWGANSRIVVIRDLHLVYGWSGLPTDCDLLLDYEIDKTAWGRKEEPWTRSWRLRRIGCGPWAAGAGNSRQ